MKTFGIKELEHYSGVKAHTLRIWEQRYQLLTPARTGTNLRVYGLTDFANLLDIALLNRNGIRISAIAGMNAEDIKLRTKHFILQSEKFHHQQIINELIYYMFSMDVENFERLLEKCIASMHADKVINEVVVKFLEKIRLTSYNDDSSEIHFAVTAVRKKVIALTDKLEKQTTGLPKKALLFLPKGEHYDLILLIMNYNLLRNGTRTLYLGTNVSLANVLKVISFKKPAVACTYIVRQSKYQLPYIKEFLVATSGNLQVNVMMDEPVPLTQSPNVRVMHFTQQDHLSQ